MSDIVKLWFAFTWLYVVVLIPLVLVSWRRVAWRWWELAALFVPFVVWTYLDKLLHLPKSLANLGEYAVIVIGVPIAALIRILVARRLPQTQTAVLLQVLLIGAIVFEYLTTPYLEE